MQADNKTVRPTAMALAFVDAACGPKGGKLAVRLGRIEQRNPKAGLVQERSWDAKVSYRTAQKLKQQEVL
jgi:hypothetical protein